MGARIRLDYSRTTAADLVIALRQAADDIGRDLAAKDAKNAAKRRPGREAATDGRGRDESHGSPHWRRIQLMLLAEDLHNAVVRATKPPPNIVDDPAAYVIVAGLPLPRAVVDAVQR